MTGDPANQIFPENRPKDENGATIQTPFEAEQQGILNSRIAREKAMYEQGMRFSGGHDWHAYHAGVEGRDEIER